MCHMLLLSHCVNRRKSWAYSTVRLVWWVSLTNMRNTNNPALQAERFMWLSDKSDLAYQGHTGFRSCTVLVLCLQRFSNENRDLSHKTSEAATRTPEAATVVALLLLVNWGLLVSPNWDNTSAGSWCSAVMFALLDLTRFTRGIRPNTPIGMF